MEYSSWQHQTTQPTEWSAPREPDTQTFLGGVLLGMVLVGMMVLLRRSYSRRIFTHGPLVLTGWSDLFRLLGSLLRGMVFLAGALLLLSRALSRRW